ncbi:hypothetical protein CDL15_Pgr010287 [Punica granatum]|uniref:Nardilysin-like n=1 Tax=Punica granatum TaxID=22663 RepID=A0A218W1W7_PUNGR|nr:hypothetical protein CDL15_Pgr010287 [Punica granatum]
MGCSTFSSDDIVIKSPNDRRFYRLIRLDNGLSALLIHDPDICPDGDGASPNSTDCSDPELEGGEDADDEDNDYPGSDDFDEDEYSEEDDTDEGEEEDAQQHRSKKRESQSVASQTKKAAAAMCVGMGSFSDPYEAQGLAHFLEHMLFMGSSKYPDENEYDSYLSKHGGSSNAYTEAEHTCYHFEVKREFLKGALERFSQFFISPLVKMEAMEREVLAVDSESLDVLESWVVELFGKVKKGAGALSELRMEVPIWKAGKNASNGWLLIDVLLSEGRGSLHSLFKARGWATSLSAGVGDEGMHRSSLAYIFGMSIHLTDLGLGKEWIFKELQDIGHMEFTFAEEQPQDDYAAELAEHLLIYPAEHVIYGDYVYQVWDGEMIKHILSFFTPNNMRIDILSKSIDKSRASQLEPWFGSLYIEEDVPPSLLELWKDPPVTEEELHLPHRNEFIPCDFSIRSDSTNSGSSNAFYPRCIIDEPLMKLWYKPDSIFKLPRANTYFRINLKGAYDDAKSCLMTELFILLLKDELNEIIYQASVAKLETSVSFFSDKLELKVYGFNHKLPILLSTILTIAKSFLPSGDRFKVIKEDLDRSLRNTNMKPLSHSSYLRLQFLCKSFYDVDEKLHLLGGLSVADLKEFIPKLRSQIYIEGLCHGNLTEEEAIAITDIFRKNLPVQPLPNEMRHKEQVICLPSGANLVRDVHAKNKSETNSVVELYFQIGPEFGEESIRMKALIDLFDEIVEEPAFNQLRTKEQLGYVVECSPRVTYRIYGFCFCVQSSKYNPLYLLGRIDNFINGLEELLVGLDDDTFDSYRSGLMSKLLEKDPSLTYETNRFWNQIVDKRYMFDFSEREAEELRSITKGDVLSWYKTYLKQSSPECRRLSVQVWGCNTNMKDVEVEEQQPKKAVLTNIDDVIAFKMSSSYYPSFC